VISSGPSALSNRLVYRDTSVTKTVEEERKIMGGNTGIFVLF
jgi:hypothetical protein